MLFLARVGVGSRRGQRDPQLHLADRRLFPAGAPGEGLWRLDAREAFSLGTGMSMLLAAGAIYPVRSPARHGRGLGGAPARTGRSPSLPDRRAEPRSSPLLFLLTVREPVRRGVARASPIVEPFLVKGVSLKPLWTVMKANKRAYIALIGGAVLNAGRASTRQIGWMPALFMRVHTTGDRPNTAS